MKEALSIALSVAVVLACTVVALMNADPNWLGAILMSLFQ